MISSPFQCTDGNRDDSPQRRRSAAGVEQEDLFKCYARSSQALISVYHAHPAYRPASRSGRGAGAGSFKFNSGSGLDLSQVKRTQIEAGSFNRCGITVCDFK